MTNSILRIDASNRGDASYSRNVANILMSQLEAAATAEGKQAKVTNRDLSDNPPALLNMEAIAGFFTPSDQMNAGLLKATETSDAILKEIDEANVLVISTPMFNFSIPASLKAWIDQVVRLNRTFSYDGSAFTGLVKDKTVYIVVAYGAAGYANNGPYAAADFAVPYLKFILNFIGLTDIRAIQVEGTNAGPDAAKAAMVQAEIDIAKAITQA
jgi:FMN-dependent NADH-azoreductase